ncbi:MAG: CsiV family protein [Arenicellales bacterium]
MLRDSRRLKFGEVHYLDHPAFGILLIVAEKN